MFKYVSLITYAKLCIALIRFYIFAVQIFRKKFYIIFYKTVNVILVYIMVAVTVISWIVQGLSYI